ncbi:MAG: hypothetical protein Q7T20_17805 [Saprospiraceae bacterium]|nr:hypothetical protein [Saprospiraceae bacterium]
MKHLLWYLAFFAFLFIGDRIAGLLLQKQAASSQFRYSRLYSRMGEADLLLLGNSRGLSFYQPYIEEITGLTTCNLSYNGLPMDAAKCLVLDYHDLRHSEGTCKPETWLIEITMCDRENDVLLAGFLQYTHRSKHLDTLIHNKLPKVWWGGQVSWLFRYNNEIFQRTMAYRNKSDQDWLLDREIPKALSDEVSKHSYDLEIHPYLIQKLTDVVALAQGSKIRVELVISPYYPGFQVKSLDALKAAVEKATGLPVHDYRAALSEPSDFGDFMHPNKKGSMNYMDMLKRDGFLP